MKANSFFKKTLVILFIFIAGVSYAPPPPPPQGGGTTGTPPCWPPPCVPIDNGIIFLLVAAGIYGGYMLYRKQQNVKSQA